MKVSRIIAAIIAMLIFVTLLAVPNLAAPQGLTSLSATARGKGTLTVGKEVFNHQPVNAGEQHRREKKNPA